MEPNSQNPLGKPKSAWGLKCVNLCIRKFLRDNLNYTLLIELEERFEQILGYLYCLYPFVSFVGVFCRFWGHCSQQLLSAFPVRLVPKKRA